MAERPLTRRDLFRGLLGRSEDGAAKDAISPADAPEASERLVARYQEILRLHGNLLPWGLADSDMPAPAEAIREAILATVSAGMAPASRDRLRHAYSSLPWFRPAEDLDALRAGKAALERQDQSEAGRDALVRASGIRARILAEVARLSREFDLVVRRSQTTVRPAVADDAQAIARIRVHSLAATLRGTPGGARLRLADVGAEAARWRAMLTDADSLVLVASGAEGIVGFCRVLHAAEPPEIDELFVVPAEWRKGYGRALMEHARAELVQRGFAEAVTWALRDVSTGRSFCEALGFVADGIAEPDADETLSGGTLHRIRYRAGLERSEDH